MERKAYSYIRFSTPDQLKGDSLRRQLDTSKAYCKKHGLILDDSFNLRDLGMSAFHGAHKKGALGEFLKAVEIGKIQSGSVLIVENLDRLSREEILTALNQFTGIINAGIRLVTLHDGMSYDKQSITENWTQLIISITYMARAHEESLTKSKRLSSAWEQKRKKVVTENLKMTRRAPAWMKLSDDRKHYHLIPEVCKAIELIFRKKLAGEGVERIAKELNTNPEIWKPAPSKRNKTGGWRSSYINKLLWNNRELLGEFQPHKKIDGKRIPEGEPIKDYYPKAIDKDLFFDVQHKIQENRNIKGHAGGKTGKATNLFTHIAVCGLCGAPLHFIDKGKPPKGGQYLHCDRSRRKIGCDAKPIRYDEFLQLFMKDFDELDISEFLPGKDERKAEINQLENKNSVGQFRVSQMENQKTNLIDQLSKEDDADLRQAISERFKTIKQEQNDLIEEINEQERQLIKLKSNGKQMTENIDHLKELFALMNNTESEEEAINIRIRLKSQIRRICQKIKIYPLQEKAPEIKEIEPGIIQWTNSKFIQRIVIRFHGSFKVRILQCQGYAEIM